MHFAYVPEHKRTSLNPWVHLPVKSLPDVVQDVWGLKEEWRGGGGGGFMEPLSLGFLYLTGFRKDCYLYYGCDVP